MKPYQPNYEKYFRRPLAWLLSFGMLASYVPASYALEEDSGEKDDRTYYEDSPVSQSATLNTSIPLVGDNWSATLPEVYSEVYEVPSMDVPTLWAADGSTSTNASSKYSLDLGRYSANGIYDLYLAQVDKLVIPTVTVIDASNVAVEVKRYTTEITYSSTDTLEAPLSTFDKAQAHLNVVNKSVLVTVTATPLEEFADDLGPPLTASFTWTSSPNPEPEFGEVTASNGDGSVLVAEKDTVYVEESNVNTLVVPTFSVYDVNNDTHPLDSEIYKTTIAYSTTSEDGKTTSFSSLTAVKNYLKTIGNKVDVAITVVVGSSPNSTTNTFIYTWESMHDKNESIYPYIVLPTGYKDNTIYVDVDASANLFLPEHHGVGTGDSTLAVTVTYTDPVTNKEIVGIDAVNAHLNVTENSVKVSFSVTDQVTEKTATEYFIWKSVKAVDVDVAVTGSGSISVINTLTGATIASALKNEDTFSVPKGTNVTFVFVPASNVHQLHSVTANGTPVENPLYRYTDTIDIVNYKIEAEFKATSSYYVTLDYGYNDAYGNPYTETLTINQDGSLISLDDGSRPGYNFLGWYQQDGTPVVPTDPSVKFHTGETLYAKWEIAVYEITFVLTEGSFSNGETSNTYTLYTGDTEATKGQVDFDQLQALTPIGTNHFLGWYTDTSMQFSYDTILFEDTTFYSGWANKYTVNLDYNGATSGILQSKYFTGIDGTLSFLPEPKRTGYTFYGWWTGFGSDETGTTDTGWGSQVFPETTIITSQSTTPLYARWVKGYGTVTFDFNYDGKKENYSLNSTFQLENSDFNDLTYATRPGYTLTNWYWDKALTNVVGSNNFKHGDVVYAKWAIEKYNVTLDLNYTVNEDTVVYTYTTGENHKLGTEAVNFTPTRIGYEFKGWNTKADGTGETVPITNSFLEHTYLYAIWEVIPETIILDPTEGKFENFSDITEVLIDPDERTILDFAAFEKLTKPVRTGYTFSHWEDKTGALVTATTVFNKGDHVYARWTPLTFTLSFDLNGGLVDDFTNATSIADRTVTYDKAIGTLSSAKKEHATFAGWYLTDSSGNLALDEDGDYIQFTSETIWNYTENQKIVAKYTYPITATVYGEGSISTSYGDGIDSVTHLVDVFEGDDVVFTFSPDTGHRIKSITVNGTLVNLSTDVNYDQASKTYTLKGVKEAGNIHFELEMVPIYEITISSGEDAPLENGSFSTSSTTKDNVVFVTEGDNVSITFTPDQWHRIKSITANGEPVTFSDSSKYTYSLSSVMGHVDLVVLFEELPKYTITATAGENGSVSATTAHLGPLVNDQMEIYHGESEFFQFYPSVGYMVHEVFVTDSSGDVKEVSIYVIDNGFYMDKVTENMSLHVTFTEDTGEEAGIVVTLDPNGGSLSGSSKMEVNELGQLSAMPADPTRTGYIFTGWWNASTGGTQINTSYVFTTNTTIYAQWTKDLEGVDYTVTFESNGGSSISSQLVPATQTIVKPSDPVRTGYTFQGWYTTSLFTTAWDFEKDPVMSNMTLYAKWSAGSTDNNTSVSRVVDYNGNPVVGATVSLMRNGSTYYSSTTDSEGYYAFNLLSAGYYNLVVTTNDGYIHTIALVIYNSSTTLPQVKLPEFNVSSSVTISTGSLAQTVGGMDTLANLVASKISNFSKILVDIAISSYSSSSSQSIISNAKAKTDVIASYFDVDVTKTVTTSTGTTYSESITDADSLVEIMISIPTVYQGKDDYSIYRIYNGSVDRISSTSNSNSERIVLSSDGTRLSIFVKKFAGSAYALAYSDANSSVAEHDVKVTSYLNGLESSSTSIGSVAISGSTAGEGDVVTVTPYPNFGFSLDNVVVKTDSGKYLTVTTNSNGTYSFTQSTSNANVSVYFNTTLNTGSQNQSDPSVGTTPQISYFSDVSTTDPFCAAINEVVSLGLMTGTGNGTFSPHDSITRGMIVAILQYMSGQQSSLVPGFTDVYSTDYYYYAVAWAVSAGIVVGYDDNTFRPDQPITREELAAILYSYSQKYGSYDVLWYFPLSFADSENIIFCAKDAVTWCVNRNVLTARYNNFFLPQGIATRAEAAVAVVALLKSQN